MDWLSGWADAGRLLDAVLCCVVAELAGLLAWRAWRGVHAVPADVYANLVAAGGLLAAAHLQRRGAPLAAVALALLLALVAHLVALGQRARPGVSHQGASGLS